MEKKIKFIEVVVFKGNYELLEYRIIENDICETFIVIEKTNSQNLQFLISETYKKYQDKIIYVNLSYQGVDNKTVDEILLEKILKLNLDYEDIILYSEEDEFFDKRSIKEIKEFISQGSFFLKQHCFWWGRNIVNPTPELGTIVFNFSQFLVDKKIISHKLFAKSTFSNFFDGFILSGWKFKNFYNYLGSEKYIKSMLSSENTDDRLVFFNSQFNVPSFFELLPECKLNPQKVFFGVEETTEELFDRKFIISFNKSVKEVRFQTDDGITFKYDIQLPTSVLYGNYTYNDFIEQYKIYELYRIILDNVFNEDDEIHVKLNSETKILKLKDIREEIKNPQ